MTMTANINAIRARAARFAKDFAKATYEMGEAQKFIIGLCGIFELPHIKAVSFEHRAKKAGGKHGRIDGFFPGLLLIEMKSAGEDLEKAYQQATGYLANLPTAELPTHIMVSDFANIHVYDRVSHTPPLCFVLADLPKHIDSLLFMAGYKSVIAQQQAAINQRAAEKMAALYDVMKSEDYNNKDLETYLVRLVFCLFADDTALFGRSGQFYDYLGNHTRADGDDLHDQLVKLFEVLDMKKRPTTMPDYLREFPHVNGALFAGALARYYFDEAARQTLLECAKEDWSEISPEIFGSLFQSIMHFDDNDTKAKSKKRREFGAHYTAEANIQKAIQPLFMETLKEEFRGIMSGGSKGKVRESKLRAFQQKLADIRLLDPACGCGNFLVVAYREIRLLELDVIEALYGREELHLDVSTIIKCNVDQCYGIEIDEAAVQIATVALWLTDHQMNMAVGNRLGTHYARLPLDKKANIVCANALRIDWNTVLPAAQCSYIVGNPPFIGSSYQSKEQKADLAVVFKGLDGAGVLDYVAAWYVKAAVYIKGNSKVPVAFVSTNSICQGEQSAILWRQLFSDGIQIHFAHRTFRWSNEGRGIAAVHCVIIAFGLSEPKQRTLYDYGDDIAGDPVALMATNINPYLVDAPTVLIGKRRKPLCAGAPEMVKGSQPTDGGHLLLSSEEADSIRKSDPVAAKYICRFLGADEFINNVSRYCLWLKESTVHDRKASPEIQRRLVAVKKMRLASPKIPTQKLAETPYLFGEDRQTDKPYLLVPSVSSEQRQFVPIGYLQPTVIASNLVFMLPSATHYHFGMLTSTMHNAWMRITCGRMKSDYRYSNTIVYNNFPWPKDVTKARQDAIEGTAKKVLEARTNEEKRCAEQGQSCSLAALYAAGNMPANLLKAHAALDKAVDAAYGYKGTNDDASRVVFLFGLYGKYVEEK
jgi:restriction-modification enzyme MmeI-like protein